LILSAKRTKGKRTDVLARIEAFNRDRDPALLKHKYRAMRDNPFSFFLGTAHLFYASLPAHPLLRAAPPAWICGDLHLENLGAYKGDNRQVYFDLNDFDEGALAPCTWDVVRFATSVLIGAKSLGIKRPARLDLARRFIDAHSDALATGKALWIERETASGMILELIEAVRRRSRRNFLDERTVRKEKRRKLLIDGTRMLRFRGPKRKRVLAFMKDFARRQQDRKFFRPVAIARRIAGLGSLGLEHYALLVRGKGSPDGNYVVDLKQEPAAALRPYLRLKQPRWKSQAERVVSVQRRVQAIPPAFLQDVAIRGKSFVLKELHPTSDKIYLANWGKKPKRLQQLVGAVGQIIAWGQLRSSGRDGSATADRLIEFGRGRQWRTTLLRVVEEAEAQVLADWKSFRKAGD
jgi:uncharacterized protein (DUF2252 family)